jgi:hypothetical protein
MQIRMCQFSRRLNANSEPYGRRCLQQMDNVPEKTWELSTRPEECAPAILDLARISHSFTATPRGGVHIFAPILLVKCRKS